MNPGDDIYMTFFLFTNTCFFCIVRLFANMFEHIFETEINELKYSLMSLTPHIYFKNFQKKCPKSIAKIKELLELSRKAFDNNQIVSVPDAITEEFKQNIKERIERDTDWYNRNTNLYHNSSCLEILNLIKINYLSSISYAEKLDLPLTPWAKNPNSYFYDIIKGLEHMSVDGYKYRIKNKLTNTDTSNYKNIITQLSESVYSYVGISNYEQYKNAELFFNNRYKRLNKLLYENYNVQINGKSVSRAWNKMIEILNATKLLDDYTHVKAFHVCEAPGNFIEAIKWFLNKKNIPYSWNAQSLVESEISDFYGMIEKTKDKWDYGPYNTGDILDTNNFNYYTKKYNNVNLFVGDCGEKWTPDGTSSDLSTKQLEYGLTILCKGGSMITKSFINISDEFLILLSECFECFEHVYIYKSYMNFWSQEIYICCKNFKGKRTFTNKINKIVLEQYIDISKKVITIANTYKTFFVYCSFDIDKLYNNKEHINKIINNLLYKWLDTNIKPLIKFNN